MAIFPLVALFALSAAVSAKSSQCGLNAVCYALDESGSISAAEFDALQNFTVDTARSLKSSNPAAQFAAVTFNENTKIIKSLTTNVENDFIPAVQGHFQRRGGTNINAGLRTCFEELQSTTANVKVIILITDGQGAGDPSPIDDIRANNILVVTVGLGNGVDEDFLLKTATTPDLFIPTTFQDIGSLVDPLIDMACAEANCRAAFDTCEFTFEGVTALPTYNASSTADVGFTPNVIAKDSSINLGVLNMNNVVPEFIDAQGATEITQFAQQPFSPTQFKPYSGISKSKVGHETYQGNQAEEAKNRCVRVFFSDYQILNNQGNVIGNINNVPKSDNKCVVFQTAA